MRKLIRDAILSSAEITAIIPAERWFQQSAIDKQPQTPFGVIAMSDTPRTIVGSFQPRLYIWVHDERGSYVQIDHVLDLVRSTLESSPPLEDSGNRIVHIQCDARSADFTDEELDTNVRNDQYTLTGRK